MIIKKATLGDVPKIVDLWIEFMEEHDYIIISENSNLRGYEIKDKEMKKTQRKFLKSHIKSTKGDVFIAEENGGVVGYTLIFIKDEIPIYKNKKIGYISDLYVKKGFRNRGISSKFKDKSMEWFKKRGVRFIAVPVYPANKLAHSVYKNWGFLDYKLEMRKKI